MTFNYVKSKEGQEIVPRNPTTNLTKSILKTPIPQSQLTNMFQENSNTFKGFQDHNKERTKKWFLIGGTEREEGHGWGRQLGNIEWFRLEKPRLGRQ